MADCANVLVCSLKLSCLLDPHGECRLLPGLPYTIHVEVSMTIH